jgi:hypothetical protein
MSLNNNIPKYVETFFKSCEIDEKINRYSFFLIRYDGVVLYHNNNLADSLSKSSIGALLGGVWQAARALASFIPKEESKEGYRLSFDTSAQGVYIVPITVGTEELYLGLIYHDEINPGFIKNKIREMATSFSEFLEEELKDSILKKQTAKSMKSNDKNNFLFGDITDSEMDHLFAFAKS